MKRYIMLLIALALVLMTAGIAFAHGGVGLRINIGLPFYLGYSYPPVYYTPPVAYSYYQPRSEVYVEPYARGTVIENIYVNGRLVEKRVHQNRDRYYHERSYSYDRR